MALEPIAEGDEDALEESVAHAFALATYVPHHVVREYLCNPTALEMPRVSRIPCSVLFLDISGWTPLSEKLSRMDGGVALLTSIANAVFAPLISIVTEYGGDVIKFAGDALLVIFPVYDATDFAAHELPGGYRYRPRTPRPSNSSTSSGGSPGGASPADATARVYAEREQQLLAQSALVAAECGVSLVDFMERTAGPKAAELHAAALAAKAAATRRNKAGADRARRQRTPGAGAAGEGAGAGAGSAPRAAKRWTRLRTAVGLIAAVRKIGEGANEPEKGEGDTETKRPALASLTHRSHMSLAERYVEYRRATRRAAALAGFGGRGSSGRRGTTRRWSGAAAKPVSATPTTGSSASGASGARRVMNALATSFGAGAQMDKSSDTLGDTMGGGGDAGDSAAATEARRALFAKHPVRLKVGISSGYVAAGHVGGIAGRWEYLVAGQPVAHMAEAEGVANAGDVVIHASSLELLRRHHLVNCLELAPVEDDSVKELPREQQPMRVMEVRQSVLLVDKGARQVPSIFGVVAAKRALGANGSFRKRNPGMEKPSARRRRFSGTNGLLRAAMGRSMGATMPTAAMSASSSGDATTGFGAGAGGPAAAFLSQARLDRTAHFDALAEDPESADLFRGYVPRAALDRLDAFEGSWDGELRRITILFVMLPNANDPEEHHDEDDNHHAGASTPAPASAPAAAVEAAAAAGAATAAAAAGVPGALASPPRRSGSPSGSSADAGADTDDGMLARVGAGGDGMGAGGGDDIDDSELNVSRVQLAVSTCMSVVKRYTGSVRQFIVDDKGAVFIAAFGLPPFAHSDDTRRAVEAAMDMERDLAAASLECSIGVTTGRVFCGNVGSATRREYAMVGDAVNLSARLMAHARKTAVKARRAAQAHADEVAAAEAAAMAALSPDGIATPVAGESKDGGATFGLGSGAVRTGSGRGGGFGGSKTLTRGSSMRNELGFASQLNLAEGDLEALDEDTDASPAAGAGGGGDAGATESAGGVGLGADLRAGVVADPLLATPPVAAATVPAPLLSPGTAVAVPSPDVGALTPTAPPATAAGAAAVATPTLPAPSPKGRTRLPTVTRAYNVLCDRRTHDACSSEVSFTTLNRIKVKGKSEPIPIYAPGRPTMMHQQSQRALRHSGDDATLFLFGRDDVLDDMSRQLILLQRTAAAVDATKRGLRRQASRRAKGRVGDSWRHKGGGGGDIGMSATEAWDGADTAEVAKAAAAPASRWQAPPITAADAEDGADDSGAGDGADGTVPGAADGARGGHAGGGGVGGGHSGGEGSGGRGGDDADAAETPRNAVLAGLPLDATVSARVLHTDVAGSAGVMPSFAVAFGDSRHWQFDETQGPAPGVSPARAVVGGDDDDDAHRHGHGRHGWRDVPEDDTGQAHGGSDGFGGGGRGGGGGGAGRRRLELTIDAGSDSASQSGSSGGEARGLPFGGAVVMTKPGDSHTGARREPRSSRRHKHGRRPHTRGPPSSHRHARGLGTDGSVGHGSRLDQVMSTRVNRLMRSFTFASHSELSPGPDGADHGGGAVGDDGGAGGLTSVQERANSSGGAADGGVGGSRGSHNSSHGSLPSNLGMSSHRLDVLVADGLVQQSEVEAADPHAHPGSLTGGGGSGRVGGTVAGERFAREPSSMSASAHSPTRLGASSRRLHSGSPAGTDAGLSPARTLTHGMLGSQLSMYGSLRRSAALATPGNAANSWRGSSGTAALVAAATSVLTSNRISGSRRIALTTMASMRGSTRSIGSASKRGSTRSITSVGAAHTLTPTSKRKGKGKGKGKGVGKGVGKGKGNATPTATAAADVDASGGPPAVAWQPNKPVDTAATARRVRMVDLRDKAPPRLDVDADVDAASGGAQSIGNGGNGGEASGVPDSATNGHKGAAYAAPTRGGTTSPGGSSGVAVHTTHSTGSLLSAHDADEELDDIINQYAQTLLHEDGGAGGGDGYGPGVGDDVDGSGSSVGGASGATGRRASAVLGADGVAGGAHGGVLQTEIQAYEEFGDAARWMSGRLALTDEDDLNLLEEMARDAGVTGVRGLMGIGGASDGDVSAAGASGARHHGGDDRSSVADGRHGVGVGGPLPPHAPSSAPDMARAHSSGGGGGLARGPLAAVAAAEAKVGERASLVLIDGLRGMGRGAVLSELESIAKTLPNVAIASGKADGLRQTSYRCWKPILYSLFGLAQTTLGAAETGVDDGGVGGTLAAVGAGAMPSAVGLRSGMAGSAARARIDPHSHMLRLAGAIGLSAQATSLLPLLNMVIPRMALPENDVTADMPAHARAANLRQLVVWLITGLIGVDLTQGEVDGSDDDEGGDSDDGGGGDGGGGDFSSGGGGGSGLVGTDELVMAAAAAETGDFAGSRDSAVAAAAAATMAGASSAGAVKDSGAGVESPTGHSESRPLWEPNPPAAVRAGSGAVSITGAGSRGTTASAASGTGKTSSTRVGTGAGASAGVSSRRRRVRGVCIFIRNAHLMDSSSLALLWAVRRVPLVLVMASIHSAEDAQTSPDMQAMLDEADDRGNAATVVVRLPPLNQTAVTRLVAATVEAARVSALISHAIFRRTHGVPLFVIQLVADLMERRLIHVADGVLTLAKGATIADVNRVMPDSMAGLLTSFVDRLDAVEQTVLKLCAAARTLVTAQLVADIHPDSAWRRTPGAVRRLHAKPRLVTRRSTAALKIHRQRSKSSAIGGSDTHTGTGAKAGLAASARDMGAVSAPGAEESRTPVSPPASGGEVAERSGDEGPSDSGADADASGGDAPSSRKRRRRSKAGASASAGASAGDADDGIFTIEDAEEVLERLVAANFLRRRTQSVAGGGDSLGSEPVVLAARRTRARARLEAAAKLKLNAPSRRASAAAAMSAAAAADAAMAAAAASMAASSEPVAGEDPPAGDAEGAASQTAPPSVGTSAEEAEAAVGDGDPLVVYSFASDSARDLVYQLMPYETSRDAHAAVGAWLEQSCEMLPTEAAALALAEAANWTRRVEAPTAGAQASGFAASPATVASGAVSRAVARRASAESPAKSSTAGSVALAAAAPKPSGVTVTTPAALALARRRRRSSGAAMSDTRINPEVHSALLPDLAYHWSRTADVAQAQRYLEAAANHALDNYANAEAVDFMGLLVAEETERPPVFAPVNLPPLRRAMWLRRLAEVYVDVGALTHAHTHAMESLERLAEISPDVRPLPSEPELRAMGNAQAAAAWKRAEARGCCPGAGAGDEGGVDGEGWRHTASSIGEGHEAILDDNATVARAIRAVADTHTTSAAAAEETAMPMPGPQSALAAAAAAASAAAVSAGEPVAGTGAVPLTPQEVAVAHEHASACYLLVGRLVMMLGSSVHAEAEDDSGDGAGAGAGARRDETVKVRVTRTKSAVGPGAMVRQATGGSAGLVNGYSRTGSRSTGAKALAAAAAHAWTTASHLQLLRAYCLTMALHAARRAGTAAPLAAAFGECALSAPTLVLSRSTARRYISYVGAIGDAVAPVDRPAHLRMLITKCRYEQLTAASPQEWVALGDDLVAASQIAEALANVGEWEAAVLQLAWTSMVEGEPREALQLSLVVSQSALSRDDTNTYASALMSAASAHLAMRDPRHARSVLVGVLQRGLVVAPADVIRLQGLLAQACVGVRDPGAAQLWAVGGARHVAVSGMQPSLVSEIDGYVGLLEALLCLAGVPHPVFLSRKGMGHAGGGGGGADGARRRVSAHGSGSDIGEAGGGDVGQRRAAALASGGEATVSVEELIVLAEAVLEAVRWLAQSSVGLFPTVFLYEALLLWLAVRRAPDAAAVRMLAKGGGTGSGGSGAKRAHTAPAGMPGQSRAKQHVQLGARSPAGHHFRVAHTDGAAHGLTPMKRRERKAAMTHVEDTLRHALADARRFGQAAVAAKIEAVAADIAVDLGSDF